MAGRFIKLYDKILNWEWYQDANTFRLFIHLLLKANYKDVMFQGLNVKRGQLVTSLTRLAANTGLSIRQTRDSLEKLKMTHEVTCSSTRRYTVITIVKYDDYQSSDTLNDKQMTHETADKRHTNDTQNDTQNDKQMTRETATSIEYIESYNDRNIDSPTERGTTAKRFVKPTQEEIFDFCMENKLNLNVDKFYNHYESVGWRVGKNPMKDWKAAVRKWASEDAKQKQPQQKQAPAKQVVAQQYTQRSYLTEDEEAMQRMIALGRGEPYA